MVRVLIEVLSGTACFSLLVRAESIEQALSQVRARFPGDDARVVHPIDPETFFVKASVVAEDLAGFDALEQSASDLRIRRQLAEREEQTEFIGERGRQA